MRCFESERRALLKLKDEFVDEDGRLSSWGAGENGRECCEWSGVHCHNRTNHVTQLNLGGDRFTWPLQGMISIWLLELKHLTYLNLSNNYFGGSNIPAFLGSFEKLRYLDLSYASLSGHIPRSVGNLSELIYLDFSKNYGLYSGNLHWISRLGSLRYLNLGYVDLGIASNWLQTISKLTSITELHFESCSLQDIHPSSLPSINASSAPLAILDLSRQYEISSSILEWFLNFSTSLSFIDLSMNNITSLNHAYAFDHNQIFLAHLDLYDNSIEGGIPKSFGNMSSLMYLNLDSNLLTAPLSELMTNLSGPLEKKLQHLGLGDNMISGSLPDFSRFPFLQELILSDNHLNGSFAKDYLNLPSNLRILDLSSNNFVGTIPDLTIFPFLQRLYLDHNMFHGQVKESIGCMATLEDLFLGSNLLEGIITEVHLFNLSRLEGLDLSYNERLNVNCSPHWIPPFQLSALRLSKCNIGPRFPQWLESQTNLDDLDISFSHIADTIPSWFGDLISGISYLKASNNRIHGVLDNITSLYRIQGEVLDLSRNKFTGEATFLCHYQQWKLIDVSDNLFFGHMPNCLADSTSLRFLNAANNLFSGKIPDSFLPSCSLSVLNLRNNSFSGGIPTSLSNCKELEVMDLGENTLTSGIPAWIGDSLSSLIVLSLRFNKFHGIIPWSICDLQNVRVLDLSSNKISGLIPNCFYNLTAMAEKSKPQTSSIRSWILSHLGAGVMYGSLLDGVYFMWKGQEVNYVNRWIPVELIDLSNNNLTGDIPSEITKLAALVALNLSRNNLTGFIPENIGLMKSLDSLDLSRNHLSGGIPTSLSELSFLGIMNLCYNYLSGKIPLQLLKFDESSYRGNSGLCGRPILNKSCPGEDREINRQDSNFDDDHGKHEDDEFITKGFYVCMGAGFVVGFWGIFGTILLNRSARFAYFKWLNTIGDFIYVKVELNKARLREMFPKLAMVSKL
ncbi:receptor-like protein EIX2 [Henckelia pumila]|uniref:receptor-like protein EIX2 n=1 Tax=Henckelia pumila TaxID=405737 RepID=UPI003C6E18D0